MNTKTGIEWTDRTWNPTTGCSKISPGCKNCYAETTALKLQKDNRVKSYKNGFQLTLEPSRITKPIDWKKSHKIFVNSMSDLFHWNVPNEYIFAVFQVMNVCYWHVFQILTKRHDRLPEFNSFLKQHNSVFFTKNIWLGVSVENQQYTHRIEYLKQTDAKIKFLSIEPLIGEISEIDLTGIDWVIVGGESGKNARDINPDWVRRIRDICREQQTAFFFKQWGGYTAKQNGRVLDGETYSEYPDYELREYQKKNDSGIYFKRVKEGIYLFLKQQELL